MSRLKHLVPPSELLEKYPLPPKSRAFIERIRTDIGRILEGTDKRILLILGPCSIHNLQSAREYAKKLKTLEAEVKDRFLLVMRVYLEKPRTSIGWKGLIHDPFLDGSQDFTTGLQWARELLLELADLEIAAGTEFLEFLTPSYLSDLVCWGSIGARTSCSQPHRQLASGLPMPVGFKNSLDGDCNTAVQGAVVARIPQSCVTICAEGRACVVNTPGNLHGHVVLRGAHSRPNYDKRSIEEAIQMLDAVKLPPRLIIDCSHGNCQRDFTAQEEIFNTLIKQIAEGNSHIAGLMLESHLNAGSQVHHKDSSMLDYATSLTDPCIDWTSTEALIKQAYNTLSTHK
jgi:3-deoxy-7-phosphoheptulonate synthase